jgi:murein DD-endopeptidase MepM/ murein hydrolase activator NlpD
MKKMKSNFWVASLVFAGLLSLSDSRVAMSQNSASVQSYTVKKGDTLYAISRRFKVGVAKLARINKLTTETHVKIGQKLKVPSIGGSTAKAKAKTTTRVSSNSSSSHLVKKGDTLYSLARVYGVKPAAIARQNGLGSNALLRIGQRLALPQAHGQKIAKSNVKKSVSNSTLGSDLFKPAKLVTAQTYPGTITLKSANAPKWSDVPLPQPKPGKQAVQLASLGGSSSAMPAVKKPVVKKTKLSPTQLLKKTPTKHVRKATGTGKPERILLPDPVKRSGDKFNWPLRGRLISNFGAKEGGLHNDGINIKTTAGAEVKAADNGVVVYVGNELRGFGNLVLVKHSDDWVTAYAHNERAVVRRGQRVKRGQSIAYAGATGGVNQPQLHFEVRKKGKAVDPLKYLSR